MDERPGFGLYVHWPFCQAKCPYCDFNSHVASKIDHSAWVSAYVDEIRRLGAETEGRVLDSVFFGGGTPSLMAPETVDAILTQARSVWRPSNSMEITLEANPTSVEAGKFRAFRDAGVNRVSVGLQALNDPDLKALGRLHSAEEGRRAFGVARDTFERVSFDLIYARQNQSMEAWRSELDEALALAADHVSLYQLTVEPGTVFAERFARGGLRGLPDEDVSADMYALTQDMTEAAGLIGYETSNHAAPGAESRHNLIYWQNGDWAGVGPGAHGRLSVNGVRYATEAPKAPGAWLNAVREGAGQEVRTRLTDLEVLEERVMMGLRLRRGIAVEALDGRPDKVNYINGLSESRLLEIENGRLRLTDAGRPLLNAVLRELLA
ncbi:radical SAM family heme chaperone HemW [Boseongicola aestuarii]|uniref:Heme chaperone HemW n=1 Tax=Boseongicola aestuarii TaxID=1470561 RepID=A0A238J2T6_9RHOB|nr:radical SAM family heme chaperone HemW [Boseongicola aestuarii]SMX24976.1 Oxygen-independent coproporphyrinogen-III oxidase 1 [Boseongicola aestuarii]